MKAIVSMVAVILVGLGAYYGVSWTKEVDEQPEVKFEVAVPSEGWRNLPVDQWPKEAQSLYWEMEARK